MTNPATYRQRYSQAATLDLQRDRGCSHRARQRPASRIENATDDNKTDDASHHRFDHGGDEDTNRADGRDGNGYNPMLMHTSETVPPYQLRATFLQLPRATLPAGQLVRGHGREITGSWIPLAPISKALTETVMTHDHVGMSGVP